MESMPFIEIPVHGSGFIVYAQVDDDYDGEYFASHKWYLNKHGYVIRKDYEYALNQKTGEWKCIKNTLVYLHKEVLKKISSRNSIDHIDRNKLNNRSCNLREVSHSANCLNRKQVLRSSSRKYRGVLSAGAKYHTYVRGEFIGSFADAKCAGMAYDKKAKELWGKDAVLNFPEKAIAI